MVKLSPTALFSLDCGGAFVSAVMLLWVLPAIQSLIGMPTAALLMLGAAPAVYMLYDISVLSFVSAIRPLHIYLIATANGLYTLVSSIFLVIHWEQLMPLGVTYFVLELLILIGLVGYQITCARAYSTAEVSKL